MTRASYLMRIKYKNFSKISQMRNYWIVKIMMTPNKITRTMSRL